MRAIITGAASGIGRETARKLAHGATVEETCRLLLVDIEAVPLAELANELSDRCEVVVPVVVDLADMEAGEFVASAAREHLGGVDALISNAGVAGDGSLMELTGEEWDRTFAVDTRATWLLVKALYPLLEDARGAVVATGSVSGVHPSPKGAYSPAKAAVVMLVRQLAHELGPAGIRCNCVSPAMTRTGLSRGAYSDPSVAKHRTAAVPLGRIAEPDDIAAVIVFLARPGARYITGANVIVDGGVTAALLHSVLGSRSSD